MAARRLVVPLLLVLAVPFAPPRTAGAQEPTVIKTATLAPDGSAWMEILNEMDDRVREATSDRVRFRFYPGGIAGDEAEVIRKLQVGQLHAGGFTGQGLGRIYPPIRIMEIPFLYRSDEEIDAVRAEIDEQVRRGFAEEGYHFTGWAEAGWDYFFSNRQIRRPRDLRAATPWVWEGDTIFEVLYDEMGVEPVPLALPDVLTSLQTNLIDTVVVSPLASIALQWYPRARFVTDLEIHQISAAILIKTETLDGLSDADRQAVIEETARASDRIVERSRADHEESRQVLQRRGLRFLSVPDPAVEEFRSFGRDVGERLAGDLYERELLERVREILAEMRGN